MFEKKEYTTIQLSRGMRKKLMDLKFELRCSSYEEVIEGLLKIKGVVFTIKRGDSEREINGASLYDKLIDGWEITGYKLKK